ncbi:hypothetical protein C7B76_25890 [filamentous cyanobacterium CCP2]|nr:hypothetical protein C7B76_25890 [filamentous cyanobacterium CCP2]
MRRKSLLLLALVSFSLALLLAAAFNLIAIPSFNPPFEFAEPEPSQTEIDVASTHLSVTATGIPTTVKDAAQYGYGLRRTMNLLHGSTPEHPNTVRVLFYGQSITRQSWWLEIEDYLRQRFPNANLLTANRAIGGFDSTKLVRTAEHDLYSFYPDLMIFHVYGNEEDYESIIANARRRTTTEILLISDHVTWLPGTANDLPSRLEEYEWHNQHSEQWLPQLAKQYGCELIEIRRPWEQYLRANALPASTMLIDNVHLNDRGNALMATLVRNHLQQMPIWAEQPDMVQTHLVGTDVQWNQGKLVLEFEGNRIDLLATTIETMPETRSDTSLSVAKVLIDGKPPSEFPELYAITRPSDALGVDQPAVLQVSAANSLIPERWTAVITEINDTCDRFKFKVYGSETGFDGEGQNERQFVSQSGRVVIDPEDWWLDDVYDNLQIATPAGFQIQWQVEPLFTNVYVPPIGQNFAQHQTVTVAQNLPTTEHTLELIAPNGEVPITAIRTYQPPLP